LAPALDATEAEDVKHRRKRRVAAWIAAILLLAVPSAGVGADRDGLRVIGTMRYELRPPFDLTSSINSVPRFFVDPGLHRGFLLAGDKNDTPTFVAYDLVRLRRMGQVAWPQEADLTGLHPIVDPVRHRIFVIRPEGLTGQDCRAATQIVVIDTRTLTSRLRSMPCIDGVPFSVVGLSYHSPTNKLYAVGMPASEFLQYQLAQETLPRQSVIFAQLDAETLAPDWTLNASSQCQWGMIDEEGVVRRVGDHLISFCYTGGPTYNFGGARGQALDIPLENDRPVMANGLPNIHASFTYADRVHVKIDPVTGRLLIRSDSPPFGPAVWGYDAIRERFVGVVPAGVPYGDGDDEFNGARGRRRRRQAGHLERRRHLPGARREPRQRRRSGSARRDRDRRRPSEAVLPVPPQGNVRGRGG
jgi:hypothetical protein